MKHLLYLVARLAAFCAVALLAARPGGTAQAALLWEADAHRETSVFEGLEEKPGTITTAQDPLGLYGLVYRYQTWDNNDHYKERVESRGNVTPAGKFRLALNHDYYIGWRALWNPMPIKPGWVALFQMHGYGPPGQGAPLVLRCVNGDGNLYFQNNANGVNVDFWHTPFKADVWHTFVVHVYLSTSRTEGFTELWYDGAKQTFINGKDRWNGPTWDPMPGSFNLLKWGCYRSGRMNGSGPATAYMSDARIGTTYEDVAPSPAGTAAAPIIKLAMGKQGARLWLKD
jgi:hypothetical protein